MGTSQSQLANDIQVPANRLSQIILGQREITADSALRLRKYRGRTGILVEPADTLRHEMEKQRG